ncbi:MAG: stalk domain-containing protein [Defluviitaleaceae bacterium]|nr:stalk domain-containing protein [Defluviitaleaceae bacterium]
MRQKIFMCFLVVAMLFYVSMVTNFYAADATKVMVSTEGMLRAAVIQAGNTPTTIVLMADIELMSNFAIPAGADITLRSEGSSEFSLIANRSIPAIHIQRNAILTMENIGVSRAADTFGAGVINNGSFIMNSGNIINNDAHGQTLLSGVINYGVFVMNGGVISQNNTHSHGVVNQSGGIFEMNGGTISENATGVINLSSFIMFGGNISRNNDRGVTIAGSGSVFTMHNGRIEGNGEGGVWVQRGHHNARTPEFTMYNGIINGNHTPYSGGGVSNDTTFNMHGGRISNNAAADSGGGIFVGAFMANGATNIYGGWIYGNSASSGADLFIRYGRFHNNLFDPNLGAIGSPPPPTILSPQISQAHNESVVAQPTTASVLVNGQSVRFQAYNISGNNFFRLRDIAYALNGTTAQFNIDWDAVTNAIILTIGQRYQSVGGELQGISAGSVEATPTESTIFIDGQRANLTAFNIAGSNYFMLRDLGVVLNFGVDWNAETSTILIIAR